ncbi:MAG TPA: LysM peptidoglycan-binding domain-containing protein [Pseudolysinimonas sp.]|nr:LysM peptidoglycan-binding domain-containing protein [Pseudolysinimonas sp.]
MSTMAFQQPQPHLRITRRGRAVLTVLIAIPLAIGAAVTGFGALGAAAGTGNQGSDATFHYVTVESGESLWQVAETVAPSADPRDVVANILSLNNLSSGEVEPGQRLAIPAQYSNSH